VEAEIKRVRVVEQVGVQDGEEKEVVTPAGRTEETVKETDGSVPKSRVAVMVLKAGLPGVMGSGSPLLVREKSKAACTVKVNLVKWVVLPPVPVTVMG
jgi:hypothetical protein